MGWTVYHTNSYVEALTTELQYRTNLGDKAFKGMIKMRPLWWVLIQSDQRENLETQRTLGVCVCTEEGLCGDTATKSLPASQLERPQKNQTCWHIDPAPPASRNVRKINFCFLRHPVYGILFWKPYFTDITSEYHKAAGTQPSVSLTAYRVTFLKSIKLRVTGDYSISY